MPPKVEPERINYVPFQNTMGVFLTELKNGRAVRTIGPLRAGEVIQLAAPEEPTTEVRSRKYTAGRLKKLSRRQERRIADDVGGRAQPASGSLPCAKGDVRKQGRLRVEAKFTYAKSYNLTMGVLDKIVGEAQHGELPCVQVNFLDKLSDRALRSVVVVPYEDWLKEVSKDAPVDDS